LKLEIRDSSKAPRVDAYVVFATADDKKRPSFTTVPQEVRAVASAQAPAQAGAEGSLYTAPLGADAAAARLYVIGAGKVEALSPRKARTVLRGVLKTLNQNGETSAVVDFPFPLQRMSAQEAREFLFGAIHAASYAFLSYKSGEHSDKRTLKRIALNAGRGVFDGLPVADLKKEVLAAQKVATAVALMRDLGNTPSNDMRPRQFAEIASEEGTKRGVKVSVLDRRGIEKERMGGLLAVSSGAVEEPRFVMLDYRGARKDDKPIVLVGKGVTFDSGGISIKPAERMGDMKWDMMGAATVVGVVLAAADLKLPVNLVGLTPLTENLPSGSAYKPGDIVRFRNGKTAEIDNTDAEGRVILADALDYAAGLNPQAIVDYATLTGAALVALGLEAAILFTDHDELASELLQAGERTDDRLWRLPMWEDYKENIRSDWADFKNTGGRYGGSINGAMFLREFVPKGTPWAHLDIAPTAYHERDHAGYSVGATGFGLALTLRWLRDRTSST